MLEVFAVFAAIAIGAFIGIFIVPMFFWLAVSVVRGVLRLLLKPVLEEAVRDALKEDLLKEDEAERR